MSSDLLDNWDIATGSNRGGSYEVGYINSTGAHGSSGKGFTQYWDMAGGYSSAQNCWLADTNIAFSGVDEWWFGYWLQFDPSWDWGSVASLKLCKIHFSDGTTWDLAVKNSYAALYSVDPLHYLPSQVCSDGPYYFCYTTDEWGLNMFGCWDDEFNSGWHYFIWHFKHSTGVLELTIDGVDAAKTSNSTNYQGTGWDPVYGISFGGNITNGGGGVSEMWTKYDDVIGATTLAEVEAFLGVDGEPDPPPDPPEDVEATPVTD